jgi:F-type H+-transporting ATPase subunit epsilon
MTIEIITPEKTVFKGKVTLVQFPGRTGSFEVLYGHAPLVASLKSGKIRMKDNENKITVIDIQGGTVEVDNNYILVLAD